MYTYVYICISIVQENDMHLYIYTILQMKKDTVENNTNILSFLGILIFVQDMLY